MAIALGIVSGARGGPLYFDKLQSDTGYLQMALSWGIDSTGTQSFDLTPTPWQTPVSFSETQIGGEDELRITGYSRHVVAPHFGEAPEGGRCDYEFAVIRPTVPFSLQRSSALVVHPGPYRHWDIFQTGLIAVCDGSGGIDSYGYRSLGLHRERPVLMYEAALVAADGNGYGDAVIILDESDRSIVVSVLVGRANFADLTGASIRRAGDDAMVLDLRGLGNWRDAQGMGIVGEAGLNSAATFPGEYLDDLKSGRMYVEIIVANGVIAGDLREILPEERIIPEPATIALSVLALTALGGYARRRVPRR